MATEISSMIKTVFPSLNDDEVTQLTQLAQINTYPANCVLCHEGAYENIFYLVLNGQTVITKQLNDREDLVLRYAGSGEFFGEMAIIQDAPRAATVKTTMETQVLELDKEAFASVISQNAQMALGMVRTTLDRLRANDLRTIQDLRQAFHNLERLDRAKLDFIEVTAHELRTPLTVMRGYASILNMDPAIRDNSMLIEVVQGIVNGTNRLHEIVNNMLDVQRIDMRQIEVAATLVSLQVIIRGLEMDFRENFEERKLHYAFELPPQETPPVYVEADPLLLNKALHQILLNAIKYTPDGGTIHVKLAYEPTAELGMAAHITIADTGIGIDEEHHRLIFEKFYRLGDVALHSSGRTQFKAGGPGLGLAIAHGVITAHGGRVWVESSGHDEVNYPGSTFHVMLPLKRSISTVESGHITTSGRAFGRTERPASGTTS